MRFLIIGFFLIIFTSCSSKSIIAVDENLSLIRKFKRPVKVKNVTFKGKRESPGHVACRLEGTLKFSGSDGILSYINKSIKDELTREKKWSSKGDSLAIDFKEIFFSTIQKYNWRFKGTLKYQNKAKKDFKFTYEIPAVMWSKYNCKHAISDYKKAKRELFTT